MSATRSTRGNPAMGDIVRSMLVIAVIILAIYGIGKFFTSNPEDPVQAVDYTAIVTQARPAAGFALLAPASLPAGWRATSARFDTGSWHLGVLTNDDEYIGLEQVTSSVKSAVTRFAADSTPSGSAQVAGQTWTVRKGPDSRLTYVRNEAGLTTLVLTTGSRALLERYVTSLS